MTATTLDPQAPDTQPDPPKHRVRRVLLITGGALTAAIVAASIAGAASGHKTASPRPAAAPAAPVVTAMDTWCAGDGYTALQAVEADASALSTDASAGDAASAEADGAQMAADAETASVSPPPVGSTRKLDYGLAMAWTMASGNEAANGDFTSAATAIEKATVYINDDAGILSCSS
jgi:hypothetical protein